MVEKLTAFDPAEGLTSHEAITAFMADAFASGTVSPVAIHVCRSGTHAE